MFRRACILLIAALAVARAQQPSVDSKCVIDGTASDALTGELLRKVTVRLNPEAGNNLSYSTLTDLAGHFHIENIAAGEYTLHGEHAGYLSAALGSPNSFSTRGTILHLVAGEKLGDLHLKLMRGATISGKVLDENDEPVLNGFLYAYSASWARGSRQYLMRGLGRTTDTGEYRISGLGPGRYFLYAASDSERSFVEQPGGPEQRLLAVFYPESPTLKSAAPLQIAAGQDLTGIDFRLHTGTVFHIRGKIAGTDLAKEREHLSVEAVESALTWGNRNLGSGIEKNGSFDIEDVPAGSYDLVVIDDMSRFSIATIPVEVKASHVNGIQFLLPNRLHLKVTVLVEGSDTPSVSAADVSLSDVRGTIVQPSFAVLQPDGTFQIRDVWPGKYFVRASPKDRGNYVKSILYGGEEALADPVDVTSNRGNGGADIQVILAKGAGKVEGTIQPPEGEKGDGYNVALISGTGVLSSAVDQNGHFSFQGIPPGKYHALAATGVEAGLWQNSDFYSQLRDKGIEFELPESGDVQIQVPIVAAADIERATASLVP